MCEYDCRSNFPTSSGSSQRFARWTCGLIHIQPINWWLRSQAWLWLCWGRLRSFWTCLQVHYAQHQHVYATYVIHIQAKLHLVHVCMLCAYADLYSTGDSTDSHDKSVCFQSTSLSTTCTCACSWACLCVCTCIWVRLCSGKTRMHGHVLCSHHHFFVYNEYSLTPYRKHLEDFNGQK